jgi:glycosyltransferase involved in cell wall biosynthesis
MNVLFISNDPLICEEQSAVRERMRQYAKELGNLHIFLRGPASVPGITKEELGESETLTIHRSTTSRFLSPFMVREVQIIVRRENIELVAAQDPFEYGWIGMKAVRGTRARLHVQIHTDFLSPWFVQGTSRIAWLNRIRRVLADQVLPKTNGIRVVSERIKHSLLTRYKDRIPEPVVLPIVVKSALPPAIPLPPHIFTFTFFAIGRLESEKRFDDLLRAFANIYETHPGVGLFIAGSGRDQAKLKALARALGVEGQVVFLGFRTDAVALLQSADAYVQTSAYEGYGMTLVEAALAGKPIVTTDVGIVGSVLTANEDVLVVPVGNVEAIAKAMTTLIEDPQKAESLATRAQHAAQEHVRSQSQEKIVRNLLEVGGVLPI